MAIRTESNTICTVHDTGQTVFIIVAPEVGDIKKKNHIFDEIRNVLQNLCRESAKKRIRISLVAPPGPIDLWQTYSYIAPKVKAIRLDFKEHNIQISAQKSGQPLGILEKATCQMLCLLAGVTWNGTILN